MTCLSNCCCSFLPKNYYMDVYIYDTSWSAESTSPILFIQQVLQELNMLKFCMNSLNLMWVYTLFLSNLSLSSYNILFSGNCKSLKSSPYSFLLSSISNAATTSGRSFSACLFCLKFNEPSLKFIIKIWAPIGFFSISFLKLQRSLETCLSNKIALIGYQMLIENWFSRYFDDKFS